MANPIGVGDILAARVWCVLNEQAAVNTYNWVCLSKTGAGGSDQDLATTLDTFYSSFYIPLLPSLAIYKGVQVYFLKRLGLLSNAVPVNSIAASGNGTGTGNSLPRNAAAILSYNVGLRGPANRGRVYLPFVASEWLDATGRPTTAFGVLANSFLSGQLGGVVAGSGGNTSTLAWCLLHKVKAAVPVNRGEVTHAESAEKFGQMHKRGDYGRANSSPI
jgi:hypothetical protein